MSETMNQKTMRAELAGKDKWLRVIKWPGTWSVQVMCGNTMVADWGDAIKEVTFTFVPVGLRVPANTKPLPQGSMNLHWKKGGVQRLKPAFFISDFHIRGKGAVTGLRYDG